MADVVQAKETSADWKSSDSRWITCILIREVLQLLPQEIADGPIRTIIRRSAGEFSPVTRQSRVDILSSDGARDRITSFKIRPLSLRPDGLDLQC